MEINARNVRQWARLGPRGFFGQAILSIAEKYNDLIVMSADLGSSSGLERFRISYPEKFLNSGIAEQNLIGVAAGLAKEGHNVFATSFSPFIAMRASDQVRMNLGYMNLNIKAVAIGSGIGMGFLGNSHFGIEDAAVMRSIPNITVISPADCAEVLQTVRAAAAFKGPMYIRLTGITNCPIVYSEEYDFEIGKAITLRDGGTITIIATGSMVAEALKTADLLQEFGIKATVINMHTIKPLDCHTVDQAVGNSNAIITLEEHSVIGGLGSAVAEYLAPKKNKVPQMLLGLPDAYIKTGDYGYMLKDQSLTAEAISEKIIHFVQENS